jgi:hypothetical protein
MFRVSVGRALVRFWRRVVPRFGLEIVATPRGTPLVARLGTTESPVAEEDNGGKGVTKGGNDATPVVLAAFLSCDGVVRFTRLSRTSPGLARPSGSSRQRDCFRRSDRRQALVTLRVPADASHIGGRDGTVGAFPTTLRDRANSKSRPAERDSRDAMGRFGSCPNLPQPLW